MGKKKVEKPKGKFTKRQLSRWQQQKRRQQIIISIGISIIAVVTGLIATGIYLEYKPLKQTVIEVNSTQFNMDYYLKALKYRAGGQSAQYVPYLLDPVLESIEQSELIRQGALELGISISDKEVDEVLKNRDLPRNQAVSDIVRTELLLDKLRQEYFELELPLLAEQRYIMAMFLESQSQAAGVKARLETGEDFAQLAGELSLDSLTKQESGDLGWRPKGVLAELLDAPLLDDYAFGSELGVISQPLHDEDKAKSLGYWLVQVLERKDDVAEVHAQAILLASEEEAQSIKARLEAGEDFAQLAGELSQLAGASENKGDLGWLTPDSTDSISQAISDFVFNSGTELAIISEPIRDETTTTRDGYWLFKVPASSLKEISSEDRDTLVAKIQNDWLESLMDDPGNKVISYLDDEMKAFILDKLVNKAQTR